MKKVCIVLSMLFAVAIQAQNIQQNSEVAQVSEHTADRVLVEEASDVQQLELELAAIKKENTRLKMLLLEHRNCTIAKHKEHEEFAGLDEAKVERLSKKRKSNQNNLPPPL